MDFAWTSTQELLYDLILDQAQRLPAAEVYFPKSKRWRACAEAGLLGMCIHEDFSGMGYDALTTARLVEALGKGCDDMGLVFSLSAHLFASLMPLAEWGQTTLKHRLLPGLCGGDLVGANAITEAEAGSDVYALKTRATKDGEHYVLNGVKNFVTNGPSADVFIVYAVTNPSFGYMGISAFVVERGTPGLKSGAPIEKMGLNTAPLGSLYLQDCPVPRENLLGGEGQGARVFQSSMLWERACLFAGYLGMMARQLEQVIDYSKQRKQFSRAISKNQAVSHAVADMKLRLESARLLLYRACWYFDQGKSSNLDIAMSKLAVSEAAVASCLAALHLHGGIGYTREMNLEKDLRDAIPATIFSGTSEIQRDMIASELGL